MSQHVLYLTGAPASGKSTLASALCARVPDLAAFEYGARLAEYLSRRDKAGLTQGQLRAKSATVATADDIAAIDRELLEFVTTRRKSVPVLVDSHAVTKERYGFRITPYSLGGIQALSPTIIVALYTAPAVTVHRIAANAAGRPQITAWEASFHTCLQASVAATYAIAVGVAVHLLDATQPLNQLVTEVERLLRRRWLKRQANSGNRKRG